MPRNRIFIRRPGPFHVGARTNNKEWFDLPIAQVWERSADLLAFTAWAFEFQIHAYVLMNNHYHLLLSCPLGNLSEGMNYFQREFSKFMGRDADRVNRLFGGRYFASYLAEQPNFEAVYRYVYRNPVDAGISKHVETYPFSTLRVLLGSERSLLPLTDPLDFCTHPEKILNWLNTSFHEEQRDCLRRGLKRPEFIWKPGRAKGVQWTEDLSFSSPARVLEPK